MYKRQLYEAAQDYETLCQQVGQAVLAEDDTVFVCPGELLFNRAALYILREAVKRGIDTQVFAAAADTAALWALARRPECNYSSVTRTTARTFAARRDTDSVLILSEVETAACAADIKLALAELYGDEKEIWLFHGQNEMCIRDRYTASRSPSNRIHSVRSCGSIRVIWPISPLNTPLPAE